MQSMQPGFRTMPDLFASDVSNAVHDVPEGLTLVRDFLSTGRQARLLERIDAAPWRTDLKRRVQHYGWTYDYRARRVASADRLGPLPEWLTPEAEQLASGGWFASRPDQAIVNEYEPGQGIAAHVDCEPCFGDTVASLSLGSPVVMAFAKIGGEGRHEIVLESGSLLVMTGPARYGWTHAIAARKSDVIGGVRCRRERRVSVTFRTVRLD